MDNGKQLPTDGTRITLAAVAQQAGLSITTVSDILLRGADSRYNANTCKRVHKLADQLGYTPSRAAQQLASGRSGEIGLLLTRSLNNPYWVRALADIETELRKKAYRLQLTIVDSFDRNAQKHLRQFISGQVEAVIVGPVYDQAVLDLVRQELSQDFPICTFGANMGEFDMVGIDEARAARLATQHLLDMGHRRINYLCAPGPDTIKLLQVKQVLQQAGSGLDPDWVFIHEDNGQFVEILSVCSKFAERWQNAPADTRPTAMICHSDPISLAAISAFYKAGIRVPEDVSLIGCDNLPESPYLIPALTTLECRINEQMAAVVDLVTTHIKQPGRKREVRIFEPELILRESVKRIDPNSR